MILIIYILLALIVLVILFIPIKIPLKIIYENELLELLLFNIKLFPKKKKNDLDKNINNSATNQNIDEQKKEKKKVKKKKIKLNFKNIINLIVFNKYKPKFKISSHIIYSTGDSALTAQSFGIINTFFYFIIDSLNLIFNVKTPDIRINPIFEDNFILNTKLTCILYINLTQIIIIGIILLRNLKFEKLENN